MTTIESQTEYVKAMERGYDFTQHGTVAHYLFRDDQIEPSILATLPKSRFYIWSIRNGWLSTPGAKAVITPIDNPLDWTKTCDTLGV